MARSAENVAATERNKADARHANELLELHDQLDRAQAIATEASSKAAKVIQSTTPRRLTEDQKKILVDTLREAKTAPILVIGFGNWEVQQYAHDFAIALSSAHLLSRMVSSERRGMTAGVSVYIPHVINTEFSTEPSDPLCLALKRANVATSLTIATDKPFTYPGDPGVPGSEIIGAKDARVIMVAERFPNP